MARPPGGQPIYISRLSLLGFRNYAKLELELAPGIVLLQGGNAQGKSNLLEALYVLAIAKSYRATSERELVRHAPTWASRCSRRSRPRRGAPTGRSASRSTSP